MILMKAARIVHAEIFGFNFNASFPPGCQQHSVPTKMLINLLLKGGDIMDQDHSDSQPCLSIAQLVLYVHTQTRSKKLIMELHKLGLSVSYNRVLELENQIAFTVCEDFRKKGVVCPAQLRKGLFTVWALDNIDHNPSSTTAKDSFHGTGSYRVT